MQTWTLPDRHPTSPGPWADEPDRAQWVDAASDLDCLIVRNNFGALCGYVGVPASHPAFGRSHWSAPDLMDPDVHGGLTFSGPCMVAEDGEDALGLVCHVPEPGRDPHVFWYGFDCAHYLDIQPGLQEYLHRKGVPGRGLFDGAVYRDFAYVQDQCRHLAAQLAAMRRP